MDVNTPTVVVAACGPGEHYPRSNKALFERVVATGLGKVIAVFQPHLYSRTMEFDAEFAEALALADASVVLDIYGAREQPVEGITSRIITDKMPEDMPVIFEPDFSEAAGDVISLAQPGDVVLTIGAGTITYVAGEILSQLEQGEPPADSAQIDEAKDQDV